MSCWPGPVFGINFLIPMIRVPFVFFLILLFTGCSKEIEEPKHKNKGKNIIYLKIDHQEFLIKEGFSLNPNVIRADFQGNFGAENPTFYQYDYFGRTVSSISIVQKILSQAKDIGQCYWDLSFYENGEVAGGLTNIIMVNCFSKKHNNWITIHEIGYGWPGEFSPKINIINHDEKKNIISGTYEFSYKDLVDSTNTGNFYMYFNLNYERQ